LPQAFDHFPLGRSDRIDHRKFVPVHPTDRVDDVTVNPAIVRSGLLADHGRDLVSQALQHHQRDVAVSARVGSQQDHAPARGQRLLQVFFALDRYIPSELLTGQVTKHIVDHLVQGDIVEVGHGCGFQLPIRQSWPEHCPQVLVGQRGARPVQPVPERAQSVRKSTRPPQAPRTGNDPQAQRDRRVSQEWEVLSGNESHGQRDQGLSENNAKQSFA